MFISNRAFPIGLCKLCPPLIYVVKQQKRVVSTALLLCLKPSL